MTISSEPSADAGVHASETRTGRARVLLIGAGVVVIMVVVATAWLVFGGEPVQQSSEEQARERLPATAGTTATTPPGTQPLRAAPAPGLYRYQGTGREETSFPPLTEDQGPSMPATVTIEPDGCWTLRIDYNTHHWQSWTYCTAGEELQERRGATFSRRSIGSADIDNTSQFVCEPAAIILRASDEPGSARPRSCTGTGSLIPAETAATGTMTVVGREVVDVGGEPIPSVHVRYDLVYAGAQTGNEVTDLWFASSTGLPVRNEHHITVNTDTPFGLITYTEDARFALQRATPVESP